MYNAINIEYLKKEYYLMSNKKKKSSGEIEKFESELGYLFSFGASPQMKIKALTDALLELNHGGFSNSMGFEMGNAKPSSQARHWDRNRQNRDKIVRLLDLYNAAVKNERE